MSLQLTTLRTDLARDIDSLSHLHNHMPQRSQPSSPARREASLAEVVDDSDPTYSHFGHRHEFLSLLEQFLNVDVQATPSAGDGDAEDELVKKMGAIVS